MLIYQNFELLVDSSIGEFWQNNWKLENTSCNL